jgi:hypothetical protein
MAVGDLIEFGGYEWRVLEVSGGKALLLSEYVIEEKAYHSEWVGLYALPPEGVTWAECDLRDWLNGDFYNSFGEADRARISQTRVENKDNQWYGSPGGEDTEDYIFLLSLEEVVKYFGDSGKFANRPEGEPSRLLDDYNKARMTYGLDNPNGVWWWLRSPGVDNNRNVAYVDTDGAIDFPGIRACGWGGEFEPLGVRPAMWVSLN